MLMSDVVDFAAELFNVTSEDLLLDRRKKHIYRARAALYIGFWLRHELRGNVPSYSQIGRAVGDRDHTTIMHGIRRAQQFMETDADFVERVVCIATATNKNVHYDTKATCNLKLQGIPEAYQQRDQQERRMDNPEYTETRINDALERIGAKKVTVYWNGDIVSRDEPAVFNVFLDEDETDFVVSDMGRYFEIEERTDGVYRPVGDAKNYSTVAAALRDALLNSEED